MTRWRDGVGGAGFSGAMALATALALAWGTITTGCDARVGVGAGAGEGTGAGPQAATRLANKARNAMRRGTATRVRGPGLFHKRQSNRTEFRWDNQSRRCWVMTTNSHCAGHSKHHMPITEAPAMSAWCAPSAAHCPPNVRPARDNNAKPSIRIEKGPAISNSAPMRQLAASVLW